MPRTFVSFCSRKNEFLLFYFGVALNCNSPILEAIFTTPCAVTTAKDIQPESLANQLVIEIICKIQGQYGQKFQFTADVNFQWQFRNGQLTLRKDKSATFVSLLVEPPFEAGPFLTIHLHQHVSYSTENVTDVEIPYHQFERLIDFHIHRLVQILK